MAQRNPEGKAFAVWAKKTAAQAAVFFCSASGMPRSAAIGNVLIVVVTSSAV
jgi:hypothetical protein